MTNQLTNNKAKLISSISMLVIGAAVLITGIMSNKNKVAPTTSSSQPARLTVLSERLKAIEEYQNNGQTTHTYTVEGVIYPPGSQSFE